MNTIPRITQQLLHATLSRFEAQRQEALAVLELYLHNPVGVADHATVVGEIATASKSLAEAEDVIGSLQRNFLAVDTAPAETTDGD
jgi:hypothetical protein